MSVAIRIENVSKLYRLGTVGTGTLSHDLNRWWHQIRGKEDPYAKIGQVNDRTKRAKSEEHGAESNVADGSLRSPLSALRSPPSGPDYVWALRDINLEVKQGELLGIIGCNGAGKSTLLKLLSRVTAPTTGVIKSRGRIASLLEVGTGFHPELTGRENIYLNGTILGMKKREIDHHFQAIVDFSEIGAFIDTPVKRYSSGMYVRLAFAVAAHLEPEILIVDEVLAVGDVAFQRKCLGKMEEVSQHGRTVLFVSHNMQAIRSLCKSAIWLHNSMIHDQGESAQVVESYLQATARPEQDQSLEDRIAQLPQDPDFRLHDIAIVQNGRRTTSVVTGAPIEVKVDYSLHRRSPGFHIWFLLHDADGTLIFDSIHNGDEEELPVVEPGRYRSVAILPGNFLAARIYEIGISAGTANVRAFLPHPIRIPIDVQHAGLVNRAYPGYAAPGKLAPLLEWSNVMFTSDHSTQKTEVQVSP